MGKFARNDIGENFGVTMRMGWKARSRGDAVFIEHTECTERFEARIRVGRKGEGVESVQPSVVGVPSGGRRAESDLSI